MQAPSTAGYFGKPLDKLDHFAYSDIRCQKRNSSLTTKKEGEKCEKKRETGSG